MKEAACMDAEAVLSPASVAQLKASERQMLPKDGLSIETAPSVATPHAEPAIQFPITPPTSGVESTPKTSLLALVATEDMEGIEVANKGGVESEANSLVIMDSSDTSTTRTSDITLNTPPQSASPSSSASTPASDKDACPPRTGSPPSSPTQATTNDIQKDNANANVAASSTARAVDAVVDEDVDMATAQDTHDNGTAAHKVPIANSDSSKSKDHGEEEGTEADGDENETYEQTDTHPYSSTTSSAASSVASLLASEPTIIPGPESIYTAVPISREIYIIPHSSKGFQWNEDLFLKPHQRRSLGVDDMYEALENGDDSSSIIESNVHVATTMEGDGDEHRDGIDSSSSSSSRVGTTDAMVSSASSSYDANGGPGPQRRFSRTGVVAVHEIRLGEEESFRILPS
ncbi:hypothetical protein BGW38_005610 [Lunasporangiospora selenospora]|uniref:Uncharacterized protein n=1 Tax=Lunasporangiospora selenospora TaxID=979761 RepID=A0A9P6FMR9_9FUNG|nr:hypothetical protein BGW38_005610 [Lunasporangiospora selenospora]